MRGTPGNNRVGKGVENENALTEPMRKENGSTIMGSSLTVPLKVKVISHDPAILLGI